MPPKRTRTTVTEKAKVKRTKEEARAVLDNIRDNLPWLSASDSKEEKLTFMLADVVGRLRYQWVDGMPVVMEEFSGPVTKDVIYRREGRKDELLACASKKKNSDSGDTMTAHKGDVIIGIAGTRLQEMSQLDFERLAYANGVGRRVEVARKELPLKQVEAYLISQREMNENCSAIPFTLLLFITFVWLTVLHGQTTQTYHVTSAVHKDLEGISIMRADKHGDLVGVTLDTHRTPDELFDWIGAGLVTHINSIYGHLTEHDADYEAAQEGTPAGRLRTFNQVIGAIRVTQVRNPLGDCPYNMEDVYAAPCHAAEEAAYENLKDVMLIDVKDPRDVAVQRMEQLRNRNWMGDFTKQVDIEMAILNAEIGIYLLMHIEVKFERAGSPSNKIALSMLPADVFPNWTYFIPDILWVLLIFSLFQQEVKQVYVETCKGEFWDYISDIWNFIDWLSISLGVFVAIFFLLLVDQINSVEQRAIEVPFRISDDNNLYIDEIRSKAEYTEYTKLLDTLLSEMQSVTTQQEFHRLAMFWYILLIVARFFKGFRGQTRLAAMSSAVLITFFDFLHLGLIVGTVFVNFALGGYILFGSQLHEWSTLIQSVNSALAVLGGEFNFDATYRIAPLTATLWFWSYLIFLCFVVINAIVAIVVRGYTDVKVRLGEISETLYGDTVLYMGEQKWRGSISSDIMLKNPEAILDDVSPDADLAADMGLLDLRMSFRKVGKIRSSPPGVTADSLAIDADIVDLQAKRIIEDCAARPMPFDAVDNLVDGHRAAFSAVARELHAAKLMVIQWEATCTTSLSKLWERQKRVGRDFRDLLEMAQDEG
jgi:hypothetical protein